MAACNRQHSGVQMHEDMLLNAAKPEAMEKGKMAEEEEVRAGAGDDTNQQLEEVRILRARGAELEERLAKARAGSSSARERREFMQEEVEQARDYGKSLHQDMLRLARIDEALSPDKRSSLEVLRRLVCTVTEVEVQEKTALEDGRAKEEALRAEITDFTGVTSLEDDSPEGQGADGEREDDDDCGDNAGVIGAGTTARDKEEGAGGGGDGGGGGGALLVESDGNAVSTRVGGRTARGQRGQQRGRGSSVVLESVDYDPLLTVAPAAAEEPGAGEEEEEEETGDDLLGRGMAAEDGAGSAYQSHKIKEKNNNKKQQQQKKKKKVEGKALLAEGLHRIEAAHKVAKAEREEAASRLSRLRLAVARRQREEDATPGHAELLQYLLRFEELGRHALERERQLRRFQTERSALALTREFLANEARLLETIAGGVEDASKGKAAAREGYLRQLEGIVEGVDDSLANQTRLLDAARSRRRAAEETKVSVAEERKRFLAGSKELTDECYRYEALNAHLALMRR